MTLNFVFNKFMLSLHVYPTYIHKCERIRLNVYEIHIIEQATIMCIPVSCCWCTVRPRLYIYIFAERVDKFTNLIISDGFQEYFYLDQQFLKNIFVWTFDERLWKFTNLTINDVFQE